MNKATLAARLAKDTGFTQVDVLRVLDALLSHMGRALKKGEKVKLVGFGTLSVFRRRAREGRNPWTGAPLKIAARRAVRFSAGKELRKAVEEPVSRTKRRPEAVGDQRTATSSPGTGGDGRREGPRR